MKRITLISLALLSVLVSCSKNDGEEQPTGEMRFSVSYPTTKATETDFEEGDVFGVYVTEYEGEVKPVLQIGGNYVNNSPVKKSGSQWKAEPSIYWGESKYDVFAYYPYGTPNSIESMHFDVALNQNVMEEKDGMTPYDRSDFLYASSKGVTSEVQTVNLLFSHKMSKLTVNMVKGSEFEGDIPENAEVIIHNTVPAALIDLASGDVIKDPYTPAQSIVSKKIATGKYSAIIVPQTIANKVPLVEVICGSISYLFESKFQFKSGMNHTVNIIMADNPEKVKIEIGGEIIDSW